MTPRAAVLVILHGASEPVGAEATSLERARTPVLDALAARGVGRRVRTIPHGAAAGTEVGLPRLLGGAPIARGRLEAAAAGVALGPDEGAWRLDVVDARRMPSPVGLEDVALLDEAIGALGGWVVPLGGHRLLLVGPSWWGDAPPGPHQTDRPLRAFAVGPFGGVAKAARAALHTADGPRRRAWPWGALGTPSLPALPSLLGRDLLVVATDPVGDRPPAPASPAVRGLAALLGCATVPSVPEELTKGALVVWHLAAPDAAGHARDAAGKVTAIEAVDAALERLLEVDATVVVCPDHGTDPTTGRHVDDAVPAIVVGGHGDGAAIARLTERAVLDAPLVDAPALLAPLREVAA